MLFLQYHYRYSNGKNMHLAILSEKFQICIPKALREELHLHSGQQFIFIAKGSVLHLVPKKVPQDIRGMLKGANMQNYRDRKDRM